MTEAEDTPLLPESPLPPGTPRLEDLDVPEPAVLREAPPGPDFGEDAAASEPPD